MAHDPKKKKPYDAMVGQAAANLGLPQQPSAAPKVLHSPAQANAAALRSPPPAAAAPAIPYPQRVGATLRQADQSTAAGSANVGNYIGSRLQSMDNDVGNFQRGVRSAAQTAAYGYSNPTAQAPAPAVVAAPAPPKTNFNNVVSGGAASVPSPLTPRTPAQLEQASQQEVAARARTPVATVPAAGAPTPAGGGAGFVLKPGDPNSFTGANGVTKPVPGLLNQGSVASQSFGGSALQVPAVAAAAQQQPNLSVNIPRPAVAATYSSGVLDNQRAREKMISDIGSRLFAIGNPNTRGKRGMVEGLVGAQAGLLDSGGKLAADIAGGDRDAASKYDLAGVDQSGQNQRALLGDQGDTQRTLLGEQGANARAQFNAYADLQKPSQVTDDDGNLLSVTGAKSEQVVGTDGKPVRAGGKDSNIASADAVLEAYNKQVEAATDAAALSGKPVDLTALDASPLGQRAAQVIGGQQQGAGAEPPPAAIEKLKANPAAAAQFDEIFGKGASARYLSR